MIPKGEHVNGDEIPMESAGDRSCLKLIEFELQVRIFIFLGLVWFTWIDHETKIYVDDGMLATQSAALLLSPKPNFNCHHEHCPRFQIKTVWVEFSDIVVGDKFEMLVTDFKITFRRIYQEVTLYLTLWWQHQHTDVTNIPLSPT